MKKVISLLLLSFFILTPAMAMNEISSAQQVEAPKWEEYVPEKYQNPRTFPNRGKNIAELAVGVVLTDLLITAPVGIPMIVHATTKMKNQSWYEKKQIYDAGLIEAEKITDAQEKKEYYNQLKKRCKFDETRRQKYLAKQNK